MLEFNFTTYCIQLMKTTQLALNVNSISSPIELVARFRLSQQTKRNESPRWPQWVLTCWRSSTFTSFKKNSGLKQRFEVTFENNLSDQVVTIEISETSMKFTSTAKSWTRKVKFCVKPVSSCYTASYKFDTKSNNAYLSFWALSFVSHIGRLYCWFFLSLEFISIQLL